MWCVRTFYRFITIPDPQRLQRDLQAICQGQDLRGIVLIAPEGINSTLAGFRPSMEFFWDQLTQMPPFQGLNYKESFTSEEPFKRLKIRLKKEIVTLGVPGLDPARHTGTYVEPEDWNDLIQDPDVVVVDVRNTYETRLGSFQGAQDPHTSTFRSFPEFVRTHLEKAKDKKIAMYCTGGIRCEKASSYMVAQGFEKVFQLSGGILKYMETIPSSESLWQGECFVFDRRVALDHGLHAGQHTLCYGCRMPLTPEDRASALYKEGVHCPLCYPVRTPQQHKKAEDRMRQMARPKCAL